jgi:hypothetical protein
MRFEAVTKQFRSTYSPERFPRTFVVNQPGIRAVHYRNTDASSSWEGFNLYEFQGEVRLYVVPRSNSR